MKAMVCFMFAVILSSADASAEPVGKARELKGGFGDVMVLGFSRDSKTLAVGEGPDGRITFWDVASAAKRAELPGVESYPRCFAFSPDGKLLASGSDNGAIQLWDVSKRAMVASLRTGARVDAVAFSADGRTLASGGGSKEIKLWDVATRKQDATLLGHNRDVLSLAFSPDGETLISGSADKTLVVWDAKARKSTRTLETHDDAVTAVAFSPDGRTIASGVGWKDTRVRLWNAKTGQAFRLLANPNDPITSLAFSPDGILLAVGTLNGRGGIWEVASGKRVAPTEGDLVTISPDGKFLAEGWMGGENYGTVKLKAIQVGN